MSQNEQSTWKPSRGLPASYLEKEAALCKELGISQSTAPSESDTNQLQVTFVQDPSKRGKPSKDNSSDNSKDKA